MDESNCNDIYSSLKDAFVIQNKESFTIKEKNLYLNQRVKELESTVFLILQCTVKKEEMKEMIKEGLSPIVDKLLGEKKEVVMQQHKQKL